MMPFKAPFSPLTILLFGGASCNAFMNQNFRPSNNNVLEANEIGVKQQNQEMMVRGNWGGGEYRDYNGVRNNGYYNRGSSNQYYNDGYYGSGRSNNDYYYGDGNNRAGYYGDNYYGRNGVRYNGSNDGVFSTANIDPYNSNSGGPYHPLKSSGSGSSSYGTSYANNRYNDGYYNNYYDGNYNSRYYDGNYNSRNYDGGMYNSRYNDDGGYYGSDYTRNSYTSNNNKYYGGSHNTGIGVQGGLVLRANDPDLNEKTPNLLNQADFMGYHGTNESRNAFERQAHRNYYGYNNRGGYYPENNYYRNGDYGYSGGYGSPGNYDRGYYSGNYNNAYSYN